MPSAPNRLTRQFVRHINAYRYGQTYAQKHPDEDFAETFAVWLTPRSGWRRRYRQWPAIHKLRYVDRLMKKIGSQHPFAFGRKLCNPVEKMDFLLADHYGKKSKYFRRSARGYVDDKLREVFPVVRGKRLAPAVGLLRKFHKDLQQRVVRWSGLEEQEAVTILKKLESRSEALGSAVPFRVRARKKSWISRLWPSLWPSISPTRGGSPARYRFCCSVSSSGNRKIGRLTSKGGPSNAALMII